MNNVVFLTILIAWAGAACAFLQAWIKVIELSQARPLLAVVRISRSASGTLDLLLKNAGSSPAVRIAGSIRGIPGAPECYVDAMASDAETQIRTTWAAGDRIEIVLEYSGIGRRRFQGRRVFQATGSEPYQLLETEELRVDGGLLNRIGFG